MRGALVNFLSSPVRRLENPSEVKRAEAVIALVSHDVNFTGAVSTVFHVV